jgi:hypothetical protein
MSTNNLERKLKTAASKAASGRLFFLDLGGGRVLSSNPDGTDLKTLVNEGRGLPDGVVVDVAAGHIYWTNMGEPKANDGSIERADLDGSHVTTIVPVGATFTPKQLQIDRQHRKICWSDREGMRVMRSNLDGSDIETIIETGHGETDRQDARNWCVGIALDVAGGKVYWTQKGNDNAGQGRIFRANLEIPNGQTPSNRKDIELLFDGLPEPIDLELDLSTRMIYWTDRGDPPRGNTVNRAPMDARPGTGPERWPHVLHRFRWLRVQREPRWVKQKDTAFFFGQPQRHCIRRNSYGSMTRGTRYMSSSEGCSGEFIDQQHLTVWLSARYGSS